MIERNRLNLESIDKRLSVIEEYLVKVVHLFEKQTSGKALNEELNQLKKEVACLADERTIFKKK